MNTNYRENIIYACKCIHYSINISIFAFCNEELLYISSKFAPTATKILFDKYPSLTVLDKNTKYQIIKNDYHENYFIVSIKEENILVIIGPFINEEIKRIKQDMNVKRNKYPAFWLGIRKGFNVDNIN